MKTVTSKLALLLLVASIATAAFAQHDSSCLCGKIAGQRVTFEIEHSNPDFANAAAAEMNRWNRYFNVFNPVAGDGSAGGNNGKNEIIFVTAAQAQQFWGEEIDANTFGVTPIYPRTSFGTPDFNECPVPAGTNCGTFTETDVLMNAEFSRGFTTIGPPDFDDDDGPALYGATAVHELGHTLGFHHNFSNLSVMNYYQDYAALFIGMADVVAGRVQYAAQAPSSLTDIATYPFYYDAAAGSGYAAAKPVTLSQTSLPPGGPITISNYSIENLSTGDLQNVTVRFYLSADSTITSSDTFIGGGNFASFPRNNYYDDGGNGTTLTIPTSVAPGSYFVGAIVSFNSSSNDTITYNNSWVAGQKLTVTGSRPRRRGVRPF